MASFYFLCFKHSLQYVLFARNSLSGWHPVTKHLSGSRHKFNITMCFPKGAENTMCFAAVAMETAVVLIKKFFKSELSGIFGMKIFLKEVDQAALNC